MKIRNDSPDTRHTWAGVDILPGETVEMDFTAEEADWLIRHGCSDAGAKSAPVSDPETSEEPPKPPRRRGRPRRTE